MRHASRFGLLALLSALVLPAACNNAGDDVTFGPFPTGQIGVLVFLDRDGNSVASPADTVFAGARVALLSQRSNDTLATRLTDATGFALFDTLPIGEYRVAIDTLSIGDSIQVAAVDSSNVQLVNGGPAIGVVARLAFPEVSLKAVRSLASGKRVFVRGIILAGVQSFSDTTSHLADTSGTLRLTEVSLAGGLAGNNPGDSVVVLGRTGVRATQPVLTQSRVIRLATRPAPIPSPVSTATAASANNGLLDAALIQITSALISDTVTVAPNFHVTVSDGTGNLIVVLDANIPFLRTAFAPGRFMNTRGVLVPDGAGQWRLKPRVGQDVILN